METEPGEFGVSAPRTPAVLLELLFEDHTDAASSLEGSVEGSLSSMSCRETLRDALRDGFLLLLLLLPLPLSLMLLMLRDTFRDDGILLLPPLLLTFGESVWLYCLTGMVVNRITADDAYIVHAQ